VRKRRLSQLLGVVFGSALILSAAPDPTGRVVDAQEPPSSEPAASDPVDGADPGEEEGGLDPLAPLLDPHDVEEYGLEYGVPAEEAANRLEMQMAAGELEERLSLAEPEAFAGLWLEHEPEFRVVVAFTLPEAEGDLLLEEIARGSPVQGFIDARHAPHSLQRLRADAEVVIGKLRDQVLFDMGLDVINSSVEVYVASSEAAEIAAGKSLPATVRLVQVGHLARPEASVYAGLRLDAGPCTSGFSVKEAGGNRFGISTAGHCPNPQSIQGNVFPRQEQKISGSHDAEWLTTPGFVDQPRIYDGIYDSNTPYYRWVKSKTGRGNQPLQSWVCKYGRVTGYNCGTLVDKDYRVSHFSNANPTFMRVNRSGIDLSQQGDSGGPWFVGTSAWGIHVAAAEPNYHEAVYMAVNYLSGIGVNPRLKT